MGYKFIERNPSTGALEEAAAVETQTADSIVKTDNTGRISSTQMPTGIGADTKEATAGEALAARDLVYIDSAGEVYKADASSSGHVAVGFVKTSVSSAATAVVFFEGTISGFTGLTQGSKQFLSESAPGTVVETPVTTSGAKHQLIGYAISDTEISFEPGEAITLA